jgi:hypothetical protein
MRKEKKSNDAKQTVINFDSKTIENNLPNPKIVKLEDFKRKSFIGYILQNSKPF